MTFLELQKRKKMFSERLEKNRERDMTQNPKTMCVSNQTGGPGQRDQIWLKGLPELQIKIFSFINGR